MAAVRQSGDWPLVEKRLLASQSIAGTVARLKSDCGIDLLGVGNTLVAGFGEGDDPENAWGVSVSGTPAIGEASVMACFGKEGKTAPTPRPSPNGVHDFLLHDGLLFFPDDHTLVLVGKAWEQPEIALLGGGTDASADANLLAEAGHADTSKPLWLAATATPQVRQALDNLLPEGDKTVVDPVTGVFGAVDLSTGLVMDLTIECQSGDAATALLARVKAAEDQAPTIVRFALGTTFSYWEDGSNARLHVSLSADELDGITNLFGGGQ
jgi:hypothetical protein